MPNPDIFVLPSPEGWKSATFDEDQTRWLQFMGQKVKPTMAKLLGMTDYDWQTKQGDFNCSACHTAHVD